LHGHRGGRYGGRFIAPSERLRVEAAQRIAAADRAKPAHIEVLLVRIDAVRGGPLANAIATDREASEHVAMFVEPGLELGLALTNAADDGLLHVRALR
jgi:hypothetical protein